MQRTGRKATAGLRWAVFAMVVVLVVVTLHARGWPGGFLSDDFSHLDWIHRADLEHVTVLHLGMSEDYCTGGMNDDVGLLLRLMGEVRRSARRMKGVRRLEVLYGGQRLRAAAL